MKITKAQLKQIIKEELTEMASGEGRHPKLRQFLGEDLYNKVLAKMEELQNIMDRNHEMAGNRGGPYPRDPELALKALEEVL
jgi:hypothetical protein